MAVILLIDHETILPGHEPVAKIHSVIVGWKLFYINYQKLLFWYCIKGGRTYGIGTTNIGVLQSYWRHIRVEFHRSELKLITTIRE